MDSWLITEINILRCTVSKTSKLYLLTSWCRVLLEKLTGLQLFKKFPAFHGTRRFITALTSVRHLSLSWASPIQSIYIHPTDWRSILILSIHPCNQLYTNKKKKKHKITSWGNLRNGTMHKHNFTKTRSLVDKLLQGEGGAHCNTVISLMDLITESNTVLRVISYYEMEKINATISPLFLLLFYYHCEKRRFMLFSHGPNYFCVKRRRAFYHKCGF